MVALAEVEPAVARVESLPVATSADELLAERVVLAIIAALAAVLVPGHAGRLIATPLTWTDLACALRNRRPHRARSPDNARVASIAHGRPQADRSR